MDTDGNREKPPRKISRTVLLWITAGLGILLILYSIIRHFTGFRIDEQLEKYLMDGIIFAALALFMYNRKIASDEKKKREAEAAEALRAQEEASGERDVTEEGEEDLPHWERGKADADAETDTDTDTEAEAEADNDGN